MTDLLLAIAHHFLVFSLVAILAGELAICRPGISASGVARLAKIDAAYGATATLVIVVGICRVFFGLKGPQYYLHNPFFWGKMSAIVIVALLSIPPTLIFLGWRKKLHSDPGFTPSSDAVARPRRLILTSFAFLAIVLICAATMARRVQL